MECPNCRHVEDDSAAECARCGFVLSKWKAKLDQAKTAGASGASTEPAPPLRSLSADPEERSIGGTLVWFAVFLMAAGVWYLNQISLQAEEKNSPTAASGRQSKGGVSKNAWHFEGRVMDLARGAPIKGVKVDFLDLETGQDYSDATDEEGHYSLDVEMRWKMGYAVSFNSPLYQKHYWPVSALDASQRDRLRMGLDPDAPTTNDPVRGDRNHPSMTLDFALFPQNVTEEERQAAGL